MLLMEGYANTAIVHLLQSGAEHQLQSVAMGLPDLSRSVTERYTSVYSPVDNFQLDCPVRGFYTVNSEGTEEVLLRAERRDESDPRELLIGGVLLFHVLEDHYLVLASSERKVGAYERIGTFEAVKDSEIKHALVSMRRWMTVEII